MSSIHTNHSALVALDTFRGISKALTSVQNEISTGKTVSNAKDNSAIYAISSVIQSDIGGFNQISDSLNLGAATVGVARAAAEQITGLLQDAKNLAVSAQEENVDRTKLQANLNEIVGTIGSIVEAAQFNGQNLIKGEGSINILSSLDRAANGTVTTSSITINRQNLTTTPPPPTAQVALEPGDAGAIAAGAQFLFSGSSIDLTYSRGPLALETTLSVNLDNGLQRNIEYVSQAGETLEDALNGLKTNIEAAGLNVTATLVDSSGGSSFDTLRLNYGAPPPGGNFFVIVDPVETTKGNTPPGGLAGLDTLDLTTQSGATNALSDLEGLLQTSIDAAAAFGAQQTRIERQADFVQSLTDNLTLGVGALVDADLEETSSRLQALQVQQQLSIQSIAIANQSPQVLLSLFQ